MTFTLCFSLPVEVRFGWQHVHEAFSGCRACKTSTVYILAQKEPGPHCDGDLGQRSDVLNGFFHIEGYVGLRHMASEPPPEHLPPEIDAAYREGATCLSVKCYNAAATMFRLCLDLATRSQLPADGIDGLTAAIRRSLGLRLPWLFGTNRLPLEYRDLSHCIKEDGNDGAHAGTLTPEDAADIRDFTFALLERLYTQPKRIELNKERRVARRQPQR